MKPNRFLTVPSAPRYVVEEGCAAGQIPELRIPKLLKTGRFLSFLRAKNEDGSWVWLKPEVKEGDAVNQDSIRTDLILSQEEERRRRQFDDDLEAAREDSSGVMAFKFYEKYVQMKVEIDAEAASRKFLEVAAGKGHPGAIKLYNEDEKKRNLKVKGRFGLDSWTVTKICEDVKRYMKQGEKPRSITLAMERMAGHKEMRVLVGLDTVGYAEGGAPRRVVERGLRKYSYFEPSEREMFLQFLWAVVEYEPGCRNCADEGDETRGFVSDLMKFVS